MSLLLQTRSISLLFVNKNKTMPSLIIVIKQGCTTIKHIIVFLNSIISVVTLCTGST